MGRRQARPAARSETIVPIAGAEEVDGDLRLPFDQERFDAAPDVDPDVQLIAEEEEGALHAHFGRDWARASAEETDEAMTRSERRSASASARSSAPSACGSRRCSWTDEVPQTVPVRKEKIQLETDPPPEGRIESVEDV